MALIAMAAFAPAVYAQPAWVSLQSRAQEEEQQSNFAQAAADWEALTKIEPQDAQPDLSWSSACRDRAALGQTEQALKDCEAAFAIDPNSVFAHESRGLVYLKSGDYDKALADFDAAASVFYNDAFAFYGRGLAKLKLGDNSGGNADLAKATTIDVTIADLFSRYGIAADAASLAPPPACSSAPAGSATGALGLITKCAAVYCASATAAQMRTNLKHIDEALASLKLVTAQTNLALAKFKRACQAIHGDLTATGPAMDDFRNAAYELGTDQGKLKDLYDSLQRSPEEDMFANTSAAIGRPPYMQPSCMVQLNQTTVDLFNSAEDVLGSVNVDCSPSTK